MGLKSARLYSATHASICNLCIIRAAYEQAHNNGCGWRLARNVLDTHDVAASSETLVLIYQTTHHHICKSGNLKPRKLSTTVLRRQCMVQQCWRLHNMWSLFYPTTVGCHFLSVYLSVAHSATAEYRREMIRQHLSDKIRTQ
jgi:hypothetical protein